ncbi:MAG: hypothetical protein ACREKL_08630 [Chthoniobacterales bacterium]
MIVRPAVLLLLCGATALAALDGPPRSVSSSKQFVVYCDEPTTRTKAAVRAEDAKSDFLSLLHEQDKWKMPIILKFGPPPNSKRPPRFQIGIFEGDNGGNKIQIDIYDPKLVSDPEFDTQILNALALEYMYRRGRVKAGHSFERPPAWLVEGLSERMHTREGGPSAGIYASMLSGSEAPKLGDFLDIQPGRLDLTSQAIYRAQAAAFLEALLALPDGRAGLRAFLSTPRRSGDVNIIVACFPSLSGNREALGRKWVLAMARASAANRSNLMTERESARELDTILAVKPLPDPKRPEVAAMSGPYALPTIAKSQNGKFILAQLENNLLRASVRAHPLYKSLVDEYLGIVRDLERKPKKKVDKRIAAAEETRAALNRETGEVRDYMDWVETTKIKTRSPELDQALDDVEQTEQPPARTDAISRYLDAASERGY